MVIWLSIADSLYLAAWCCGHVRCRLVSLPLKAFHSSSRSPPMAARAISPAREAAFSSLSHHPVQCNYLVYASNYPQKASHLLTFRVIVWDVIHVGEGFRLLGNRRDNDLGGLDHVQGILFHNRRSVVPCARAKQASPLSLSVPNARLQSWICLSHLWWMADL